MIGFRWREVLEVPTVEDQKALMPSTRRTSLVKRSESSTGRRSSSASSEGSEYQPSIGMPFAAGAMRVSAASITKGRDEKRTLI